MSEMILVLALTTIATSELLIVGGITLIAFLFCTLFFPGDTVVFPYLACALGLPTAVAWAGASLFERYLFGKAGSGSLALLVMIGVALATIELLLSATGGQILARLRTDSASQSGLSSIVSLLDAAAVTVLMPGLAFGIVLALIEIPSLLFIRRSSSTLAAAQRGIVVLLALTLFLYLVPSFVAKLLSTLHVRY